MKTECRITVTEADGKLYLIGNIPKSAATTIAGKLAQAMLDHGNAIMNDAKEAQATPRVMGREQL